MLEATGPDGTTCEACVAGKYKNDIGSADCIDCGADKYSSATGAVTESSCSSCLIYSVISSGSDAIEDCKCVSGYTGLDGTTCEACVAGKYKNGIGSADCINCGADKYSSATGAVAESSCSSCLIYSVSSSGSDAMEDCKCVSGHYDLGQEFIQTRGSGFRGWERSDECSCVCGA
jgi:hypothetical protein